MSCGRGVREAFRLPITVPPFAQYQAPLVPLRGLWNRAPVEGDRMVVCDVQWLITTAGLQAIEIALTSFSPVPFSQIVAMSVDNSRSGADVDFIFPDSGKQLTVPAYCQCISPVLTNALVFYAVVSASSGLSAGSGSVNVYYTQP